MCGMYYFGTVPYLGQQVVGLVCLGHAGPLLGFESNIATDTNTTATIHLSRGDMPSTNIAFLKYKFCLVVRATTEGPKHCIRMFHSETMTQLCSSFSSSITDVAIGREARSAE